MHYKICNQENPPIFSATVLNKYNIEYFYCKKCKFLQTQEPYWLDEAYTESINFSDTGYIKRNTNLSYKLMILLILFFDKKVNMLIMLVVMVSLLE